MGVRRVTDVVTINGTKYHASALWFGLKLHRRPLYYVFNPVLPILVLALMSAFVFLLPMDSGEKLSYAINVELAFFFFLLLLPEHISPWSRPDAW